MAFRGTKQRWHLILGWDSRAQESEELQPTAGALSPPRSVPKPWTGLVMPTPRLSLSCMHSRAAVWSNSRPTPRRQHQDLLRKQKLAILCEALCEHSTPGLGELFCVYLQSLVPEEAREESTWLL